MESVFIAENKLSADKGHLKKEDWKKFNYSPLSTFQACKSVNESILMLPPKAPRGINTEIINNSEFFNKSTNNVTSEPNVNL